jgi:hypothetical protein
MFNKTIKINFHCMRQTQLRRVHTKNRDTQMARLRRPILYYRVIGDAHLGASSIIIHLRRALVRARLPLEISPRHAIKVHVVDLIVGWGHYDTNRRRATGRASPITKKFETRFNVARH